MSSDSLAPTNAEITGQIIAPISLAIGDELAMPEEFRDVFRAPEDDVDEAKTCPGEKGVSLNSSDNSIATARHI